MPIPAAYLLAQLLGTAFACGINLYAVVALLGIASRFGWITGLPVGLRGLENGLVIGSAAVLYGIQFVIDKIPYLDSMWDAVHTVIRPLAAAALAFLALDMAGFDLRIAASLIAGATALAAHITKAGFRVVANGQPNARMTVAVSLLEDAAAVALAIAAITLPALALVGVIALLLALPVVAPGLWRAALLGIRATIARLRGFFGSPGWRPAAQLPARLRPLLRPQEMGAPPAVAARAALNGVRAAGPYRNGWLVLERGSPAFLFRSMLRPRRVELPRAAPISVRNGLLTDMLDFRSEVEPFTLFLLKDGPPTEAALAEMGTRAP